MQILMAVTSSAIGWIGLKGMDLEQEIVVMQSAKIYVDFGGHPGKDRIPREAAANGCCVITNRRGSAAYREDVPIPEEYKFEDPKEMLPNVVQLMVNICNDFQNHQDHFREYREWIKAEREKFIRDTRKFLEEISTWE